MDLTGKTLGKYKLTQRLGSGGMAEVYMAFQSGVERDVAIKVMHMHLADSEDFRERFQREARAIGQLQHPNIVHVIDFDTADGNYYMVMDYLPGGTLRDYLADVKEIPVSETLKIISRLCDALSYAHARGMIHRDIKPANVMFSNARRTRVVLTDFGMARLLNEAKLTVSGTMLGTPAYMPPEVVKGEPADHRADLYSLSVMLYEMVTGRTPHVADTPYGLMNKQVNEPLPLPSEFKPDIDPKLEAFLLKALAKDPEDRFADADDMLAAIKAIDGSGATTVAAAPKADEPETVAVPVQDEIGKDNKWLWLGGGIVAILLLGLLGWVVFSQNGNDGITVAATALPETSGGAAVVTKTAVSTPTSDPTTVPTEAPAVVEVVEEPTAVLTEVPPEPTEIPTEIAPPVDIAQQSFSVFDIDFNDREGLPASLLSLQVDRMRLPGTDKEPVVWMDGEAGLLSLGVLPLEAGRSQFEAAIEGNAITDFDTFLISMEPIGPHEELVGEIAYEKTLPAEFLAPVAALLTENIPNTNAQISLAQDHTGFLRGELANGQLDGAKVHAEHVVNILDGVEGADFGDLNSDGSAHNPGDDVGVRVYIEDAIASTVAGLDASPPSPFSRPLAEKTLHSLENSQALRAQAQALALKIFATDTIEEAQPFADELERLLQQVQLGVDRDENGIVDALAGEGGILAAYNNGLGWLARSYAAENGINSDGSSAPGTLYFAPDAILLTLNEVLYPPADMGYFAWLVSDALAETRPLGPLPVANNQIREFFPADPFTFEQFDQLLITLEADPVGDVPSETAVFMGSLTPETRTVTVDLLGEETGLVTNLMAQTQLAIDHTGFMLGELEAGNLEGGKTHAEHVINILVGEGDPAFGDLDGNGRPENPGDGVGVRPYLIRIIELSSSIERNSVERQFYGAIMDAAFENSMVIVDELINKASKILASDTVDEALVTGTEIGPQIELLLTGIDKDENGISDPLTGEGGIGSLRSLVTSLAQWEIVPR